VLSVSILLSLHISFFFLMFFLTQMATKRKSSTDHGDNSFSVRVGQHNKFFRFEDFQDDESVSISYVNSLFLYLFVNFYYY
jgi:hypothetical protein